LALMQYSRRSPLGGEGADKVDLRDMVEVGG